MLSARELGIPPMQALNGGINIINGKAEISARMMGALIRKAGHELKIKEISDTSCTLIGIRKDTKQKEEASFTIKDAERAGLVKKNGGWDKCPKDMCFARALSRIARQLFSDVIGIGYVEGEIEPIKDESIVSECTTSSAVIEVKDLKKEEDELKIFLDLFSKEDHPMVMEYIKVVMKHFQWTQPECIKNFIKDKYVVEKFLAWKKNQ